MGMGYTAAPDSFGVDPAARRFFDRPFTERLERTGFERAQGPTPWDDLPVSSFAQPGMMIEIR